MLSEYLNDSGAAVWTQVMPGARACAFSLGEGPASLPLRLEALHFEALFCLAGSVTLTRRDGQVLKLGPRQVLLLTDVSGLAAAAAGGGLEGVLVAVDARGARESLQAICGLLGNLSLDTGQARRWMAGRGGCAVEGPSHWSRAAFADLERLPRSERARWCVWKSVELLYLLSAGSTGVPAPGGMNPAIARAAAEAKAYMSAHLDERLTIPELSRRFCVSATALKAAFRELYGQPIHAWLCEKRMERAAELLRRSDMSVLDISQAVGFASPSQFGANFLRRFGASPGKYRKMSVSGETAPETGGQGGGESV